MFTYYILHITYTYTSFLMRYVLHIHITYTSFLMRYVLHITYTSFLMIDFPLFCFSVLVDRQQLP